MYCEWTIQFIKLIFCVKLRIDMANLCLFYSWHSRMIFYTTLWHPKQSGLFTIVFCIFWPNGFCKEHFLWILTSHSLWLPLIKFWVNLESTKILTPKITKGTPLWFFGPCITGEIPQSLSNAKVIIKSGFCWLIFWTSKYSPGGEGMGEGGACCGGCPFSKLSTDRWAVMIAPPLPHT